MSIRRISISEQREDEDKVITTAEGLAGEKMTAELYQIHGISSNPKGDKESLLVEINGDPDNFMALPPSGNRKAKEGETLIYHGDTEISVIGEGVTIVTGGKKFAINNGKITTDLDIVTTGDITTTGDIIASSITVNTVDATYVKATADVLAGITSLSYHIHPTPAGPSGVPVV